MAGGSGGGGAPSGPPSGPTSEPGAAPTAPGATQPGATKPGEAEPGEATKPGEPPTELVGAPPPPAPPARTLVGASGGAPRRPWWRRPRTLVLAGVGVAVAAGLAVLLIERQPSKGQSTVAGAQVTRQAVGSPGRDPYTGSVAATSSAGAAPATPSAGPTAVDGGGVGLYGGTEHIASCNVPQLSDFLTTHADKGRAWAGVEGIDPSGIPDYLHTLTPVVLRQDTRVTNHGFVNGQATAFQSVLQAGTAVLVDDRGVPRARCACGNPLTPPVADTAPPQYGGDSWTGFHTDHVVTVNPAPAPVHSLVLVDQGSGRPFERPVGTDGSGDRAAAASSGPSTGTSTSGSGSPTRTGTGTPTGSPRSTASATGGAGTTGATSATGGATGGATGSGGASGGSTSTGGAGGATP
ncbi:hypothetical protein GCM10009738_00840 [Kitasatospora viridis]